MSPAALRLRPPSLLGRPVVPGRPSPYGRLASGKSMQTAPGRLMGEGGAPPLADGRGRLRQRGQRQGQGQGQARGRRQGQGERARERVHAYGQAGGLAGVRGGGRGQVAEGWGGDGDGCPRVRARAAVCWPEGVALGCERVEWGGWVGVSLCPSLSLCGRGPRAGGFVPAPGASAPSPHGPLDSRRGPKTSADRERTRPKAAACVLPVVPAAAASTGGRGGAGRGGPGRGGGSGAGLCRVPGGRGGCRAGGGCWGRSFASSACQQAEHRARVARRLGWECSGYVKGNQSNLPLFLVGLFFRISFSFQANRRAILSGKEKRKRGGRGWGQPKKTQIQTISPPHPPTPLKKRTTSQLSIKQSQTNRK